MIKQPPIMRLKTETLKKLENAFRRLRIGLGNAGRRRKTIGYC